jgi:pilus assembly protein FimV
MGSISLDLDEPLSAKPVGDDETTVALGDQPAAPADPMTRKFELADEFRQIGDLDGARELLQEVLENSQDATLKARAQSMLDSLG